MPRPKPTVLLESGDMLTSVMLRSPLPDVLNRWYAAAVGTNVPLKLSVTAADGEVLLLPHASDETAIPVITANAADRRGKLFMVAPHFPAVTDRDRQTKGRRWQRRLQVRTRSSVADSLHRRVSAAERAPLQPESATLAA